MSMKKPGPWSIAMPLSVVFLAAVYYIKVPEVRKAVDARTPLVHNLLGGFVSDTKPKVIVQQGEQDPTFARAKTTQVTPAPRAVATPAPMAAKVPAPVPPSVSSEPGVSPSKPVSATPAQVAATVDWQKIMSDKSKLPKKVTLTKPATFKAVFNGKVVGTLVAPAGSEANIVQTKDDKLGLEFNGGGGWVPAAETDLLARIGK